MERKIHMGRPTTKTDLLTAATTNYEKLNTLISELTEQELSTPFDFSDSKKKEAHWKRDRNLRDILIHLYEWHQLLLNWVQSNREGNNTTYQLLRENKIEHLKVGRAYKVPKAHLLSYLRLGLQNAEN